MHRHTLLLLLPTLGLLPAQQPVEAAAAAPSRAAVVRAHAAWCHRSYTATAAAARTLQERIVELLHEPTTERLGAAREAWVEAHRRYCRTEVLRFHDGPIEPLEPLLNAWPVDEAHLDTILTDTTRYPVISSTVLELANERGGEANVSIGWHAIEYLLWGKDLAADGPGDRPAADLDANCSPDAARRARYLETAVAALVAQLDQLVLAWRPDSDNYRRRFETDVDASVRRMLVGATVLTAFEMGGERLTVAFDTRDQENEHSCFSDATLVDLCANQAGVCEVMLGHADGEHHAPGIAALVHEVDPALARALRQRLETTRECVAAIPAPFDQAILGADDSKGRMAVQRAILAMEAQTEILLVIGQRLGFELPLQPGGG